MAAVGECSLPAPWRPVSLTHVEYPAGDFSGQLLAYLSLGPIFIIVGFVTLIIFKRELHTSHGPVTALSFLILLFRPDSRLRCTSRSFVEVAVLPRDPPNEQRVYLLYHTWSQVLYGGVAGSIMAIAWFAFTQEILTPLFPRIAAWPISEFFLIRDTSLIPNILWFEYTVTRAEARSFCVHVEWEVLLDNQSVNCRKGPDPGDQE
ncbi:Dolichyldiphosphatase 1 [Pitangus sulphuratus]|nr:Dolichyldiphosphatase 1 [Pitangus sulphuratus]